MALTIRERVLAAALAKLQTITTITDLTPDDIVRNPAEPIDKFPAVRMFDGAHQIVDRWAGLEMVRQNIDVELCAAEASPEAADEVPSVDAIYGAVKAAMVSDITLGGLSFDIREVGMNDPTVISSAAGELGGSVVTFEIDLMIKENDPTALAP